MTLLDKIDFLMKKYGLNKSTLSKNADVKYTTLDSLYKKGYSNAKLSTLMALARYFNVSLDYLVKDEITNPRYGLDAICTNKELEIIELYRNSDADKRKAIELILGYNSKISSINIDKPQAIAAHGDGASIGEISDDLEILNGIEKDGK